MRTDTLESQPDGGPQSAPRLQQGRLHGASSYGRGERARGYQRAEIWCNDCCRHAEVSLVGLPDELPMPDICLRYRSVCRGKNLMSRGSIAEYYEVVERGATEPLLVGFTQACKRPPRQPSPAGP